MRTTERVGSPAVFGLALLALASTAAASTGTTCTTPARPTLSAASARTPWGDPDLQGVWSATELIGVPLDREPALGERNVLTDGEFQARRARLLESVSPDNIEATNFGADAELIATRSRQASLVVDPPNGRRPARAAAAEARRPASSSFSAGPFNSVADLSTYDRCISFGTCASRSAGERTRDCARTWLRCDPHRSHSRLGGQGKTGHLSTLQNRPFPVSGIEAE